MRARSLLVLLALAAPAHADPIELFLAGNEKLRRMHVAFYTVASRAMTPVFQSDSRVIGWLRDTLLYPAGKIPGVRYLMRTTLGGVRKLPMGIFHLPPPLGGGAERSEGEDLSA